jgi:hypothetical protein
MLRWVNVISQTQCSRGLGIRDVEFQVEELGGLHGIAWSSMNSTQITDSDSLSPKRFPWMLVEDEDVKRHSTGTGRTYNSRLSGIHQELACTLRLVMRPSPTEQEDQMFSIHGYKPTSGYYCLPQNHPSSSMTVTEKQAWRQLVSYVAARCLGPNPNPQHSAGERPPSRPVTATR